MTYETQLKYLEDSYQKELETEIFSVEEEDGKPVLYLNSTIFYPHGGGQPSDLGLIFSDTGKAEVQFVKYNGGQVRHECQIEGELRAGEKVHLKINWEKRHFNMRTHTAGHILHDALQQLSGPELIMPVKGNHAAKAYVEYPLNSVTPETAPKLEALCEEMIRAGLETHVRLVDYAELVRICPYIPQNLPKDKPLRVMWIEGFAPVPCGGTHVQNTAEVSGIKILSIGPKQGLTRIRYQIED